MVDAISDEIILRQDFFPPNTLIRSIYFGGGTPSVLSISQIEQLIHLIYNQYKISDDIEISFEANPEDLELDYLRELNNIGINRLSIGIQSFDDRVLEWMNRQHTGNQASNAVTNAQKVGITNISIDLIYGIQSSVQKSWPDDLHRSLSLDTPHISCYALTVENQTALMHRIKTGITPDIHSFQQSRQFDQIMNTLIPLNYEHYEISNFAKPHKRSRHNSTYWSGDAYLGIGPAAHSFDGKTRYWNINQNSKYIASIANRIIPCQKERLTPSDQFNEWCMTSLRRIEGCQKASLRNFDPKYQTCFKQNIQEWLHSGHVIDHHFSYKLTQKGKHFADRIASDLFFID